MTHDTCDKWNELKKTCKCVNLGSLRNSCFKSKSSFLPTKSEKISREIEQRLIVYMYMYCYIYPPGSVAIQSGKGSNCYITVLLH